MKTIVEDRSLLADVSYSVSEYGGHPEKELRFGDAKSMFNPELATNP